MPRFEPNKCNGKAPNIKRNPLKINEELSYQFRIRIPIAIHCDSIQLDSVTFLYARCIGPHLYIRGQSVLNAVLYALALNPINIVLHGISYQRSHIGNVVVFVVVGMRLPYFSIMSAIEIRSLSLSLSSVDDVIRNCIFALQMDKSHLRLL